MLVTRPPRPAGKKRCALGKLIMYLVSVWPIIITIIVLVVVVFLIVVAHAV